MITKKDIERLEQEVSIKGKLHPQQKFYFIIDGKCKFIKAKDLEGFLKKYFPELFI